MSVMQPTNVPVAEFLETVPARRSEQARFLLPIFEKESGYPPVMWGPSIIGFGQQSYETKTRSGVVPVLAFAPRKANLVLYFDLDDPTVTALLAELGTHKTSKSCVYVTRVDHLNVDVLRRILRHHVSS